MAKKAGYVYIMTNKTDVVFYIGVTSNLTQRVFQHQHGYLDGFTKKYKTTKLVYIEEYPDIKSAIAREKQLKNWHRDWKLNLIKKQNPNFEDLGLNINEEIPKGTRDPETSSG